MRRAPIGARNRVSVSAGFLRAAPTGARYRTGIDMRGVPTGTPYRAGMNLQRIAVDYSNYELLKFQRHVNDVAENHRF